MAQTLLNPRLALRIVRAGLLCATASVASVLATAQTMVLDEAYQPQIRTRADIRLYPQSDGNLAATGADYLDDPAPTVFRISPDGTVLNDSGPMDTSLPSPTELRLPDGRRVQAVSVTPGWEMPGYTAVTTYDPSGIALYTLQFYTNDSIYGMDRVVSSAMDAFKLVAAADGQVYAAGDFTMAGDLNRSGLARIRVDGTLDPGFAPVPPAGPFRGIVALRDNSVILATGGSIASDAPYGANRITGPGVLTRIRADGTVDNTYASTLEEPELHFALDDGRIITGSTHLKRLLTDGSDDPTFHSDVPGLAVVGVRRLPEGTLLVEGGYADMRPSVFLLSADGTLLRDLLDLFASSHGLALDGVDQSGFAWLRHGPSGVIVDSCGVGLRPFVAYPTNARVAVSSAEISHATPVDVTITPRPASKGTVYTIKSDGSGRMLISGDFESIDGHPHPPFVRLAPDGTVDPSFDPSLIGSVVAVHPDGRVLLFTGLGFQRLLTDGSVDPTLPVDSALSQARYLGPLSITASGGYIVQINTAAGTLPGSCELRRYAPDGTMEMTVSSPAGLTNIHDAIPLADDRTLVAGSYPLPAGSFSYLFDRRIARLLADGSVDSTYRNDLPDDAIIETVHLFADGSAIAAVQWPDDLSIATRAVRIQPDGSIDPKFHLASTDEAVVMGTLWETPDGGFLAASINDSMALRRWRRSGARDTAFRIPLLNQSFSAILLTTDDIFYQAGIRPDAPAEFSTLQRYTPVQRPGITVQPTSVSAVAGGMAILETEVGDTASASFQWQKDGVDIAGETGQRLFIARTTPAHAGSYRCIIRVGTTTYVTDAAAVTVTANTTKLVNFSARSRVEAGRPQIAGMVIGPGASQPALLRAIGSALPFDLGVPLLWDPVLTLFDRESAIAQDHGGIWRTEILALGDQLGAFRPSVPVPPPGGPVIALATNSALAPTLAPGLYTAHTSTGHGEAGVSLFEYYDADPLAAGNGVNNISIRGATGPGPDVLIAGFAVHGRGNIRLLIRAIGPSLETFGVESPADDPRIIVRGSGTFGPDATNDNWAGNPAVAAAEAESGAFPLPPDSRDAAFVITLPAGAYTVQIPTTNGQRGEVLCEIYVLEH